MPKVCNLCISPVWLCHHKIVMMLQNSIYPFELEIKLLFYVLFCRDVIYTLYLSQKRFTHFVRKVFARWKLRSGKFRLFGPLPETGFILVMPCHHDSEKAWRGKLKYRHDNMVSLWYYHLGRFWRLAPCIPNGQHLSESSDTFTDCFSENLQNEGAMLSGNTITAEVLYTWYLWIPLL